MKGAEFASKAWGLGFTFARRLPVKHYGRLRSALRSCALQQVQGLGLGFAAWVLASAAQSMGTPTNVIGDVGIQICNCICHLGIRQFIAYPRFTE